jgi:hypothetical protein
VAHRRIALLVLGAALAGPLRLAAQAPTSPDGALNAFMRAVADSNMTRMMQLWGTENGSAAKTKQPPDYQKRVFIMYSYLKGVSYKISGTQPDTTAVGRRVLLVEFKRNECTGQTLVRTVKSKSEGWLVNSFDLASIGSPGRQCGEQGPRDTTAVAPAPSGS